MTALTDLLKNWLSHVVRDSSHSEYHRLVLGGLPAEHLTDLFFKLTNGNGSAWQAAAGLQIPVFLIARNPRTIGPGPSQECNWDFALAIRNSLPNFLLLVDPLDWDDRTYSITNATDTIARPLPPIRRRVPLLRDWSDFYADLVETTANSLGVAFTTVESAIREALLDLPSLAPVEQQQLPWQLVGDIYSLMDAPASLANSDIARLCGLLPFDNGDSNFRLSRSTLGRLASFLNDVGIESGIEELKTTARGANLGDCLDSLAAHLRRHAGSASAFVRAPCFHYVRQRDAPEWWNMLSVEAVDEMLSEKGRRIRSDRVELTCTEPLYPSAQASTPVIVRGAVSLEASVGGGMFEMLTISRLLGRQSSTALFRSDACPSPHSFHDSEVPKHEVPITYRVEAHGATPASIQIISMATYVPAGFVTCVGLPLLSISRPRRVRSTALWAQEIVLRHGGTTELRVFCGPHVKTVRTSEPAEYRMDHVVEDGIANIRIDLDDDTEITLELLDDKNKTISSFSVQLALDSDVDESAPSRFDALVSAHQSIENSIPTPRCGDSWLRRAENELLNATASWRPILATKGWSDAHPSLDETLQLGFLQLSVDPRPSLTPPPEFVSAREKIVGWLSASSAALPEIDLEDKEFRQLAADYLQAYRKWSERQASEACWVDTVSILEPEPERYGNQMIASPEPIALLLSPLHPVRLGWHVATQQLLSSGLETPCPLAGLLDPHRIPEVLSLALARSGGAPRWKPFIAVTSGDAMWGVFWNANRLRDLRRHEAISELVTAGIEPRGVQSGFTASQARRTLEEVSHALPTRAVLRIGIVGSGRTSTSCTEGLIKWSREPYNQETARLTGPRAIEIYDSRARDLQPSSQQISGLADDTRHRVRWYSLDNTAGLKDLAIVDHLGSASPNIENHTWRSPSTAGGLIRTRLRLDHNDAELVIESRTGELVRSEDRLLDELGLAIHEIESVATSECGCSHVAFVPNQQVVTKELVASRFVAVSSTEIDPACFARGSAHANGVLWDYELPDAVGPGEQTDGFYLIARLPDAVKRAVSRAVNIVSPSDVDVEPLLLETSRRGIPVLKRLASGGSLAKGELGMLLAVRLLQDAFRDTAGPIRLPVWDDETVRMVLPVDPYSAVLQKLRLGLQKANARLSDATRPDLLVANIRFDVGGKTEIRLTPIEVKFREGKMSASSKADALTQAHNLGRLLHRLLSATPINDLWRICGLSFMSAMLDHGFRVYGSPAINGTPVDQWVNVHRQCLADIARGNVDIDVAEEGRLLIFDESQRSSLEDIDGDGLSETLVINRTDSRTLLTDDVVMSQNIDRLVDGWDICATGEGLAPESLSLEEELPQRASVVQVSDSVDLPASADIGNRSLTAADLPAVPLTIRQRVANSFSGFVGNSAAIGTLKRGILKALLSEPPQLPISYLLTGNPSTGKTELARRVSMSLELPFVSLDGRALRSREHLFELIDGRLRDYGQAASNAEMRYQLPVMDYPPLVVFVDEVHLVSKPIQESLLTALEPKDRSLLLSDRLARLPQVTFLFATTRSSEVDMAFRTRCTEIALKDYTEDEVAQIVGLQHPNWPESLLREIARCGRLVPRIALAVAKELVDEALVTEYPDRDLNDHLDEVRRTRQVDENGLSGLDIEYLELLEREGRPLGERNVLSMLPNIDKDRFLEEVEPLLIARMQLVRRTGRGREITPEGRRYLIELRRREGESRP